MEKKTTCGLRLIWVKRLQDQPYVGAGLRSSQMVCLCPLVTLTQWTKRLYVDQTRKGFTIKTKGHAGYDGWCKAPNYESSGHLWLNNPLQHRMTSCLWAGRCKFGILWFLILWWCLCWIILTTISLSLQCFGDMYLGCR